MDDDVALEEVGFVVVPLLIELLSMYFGVEKPDEGFEPGACCKSFPCSAINAGPNFCNRSQI